jgi:OPA family glycerol-3-phosphate transporter-like MFS transporter
VFLIPVALAGIFLAIKLWHDLPIATKKYIAEVERKRISELAFD